MIELSREAYLTLCGLVQDEVEVDSERIMASADVWTELRTTFPLADFPFDEAHYPGGRV